MAKLHSYYILCPLIDQKSFLGVSEDKDNNNVIVTLGRNVVNTYRLSDQKQIGGWTSKDHITATVVYDKEYDSYIGIFNNNTIKMWKEETEHLEKLKKYKFPLSIQHVICRENQSSLIVLANGSCTSLSYGLDNRESLDGKSLLKNTDTIINTGYYNHANTDYVCYLLTNSQDKYEIASCPLRQEICDLERAKFSKVRVSRSDSKVHVIGKLISTDEQPVVYVLWSDSKITAYDLIKKSWKAVGTVPWISTQTNVSMAWMGEKHLILFGSDSHEDGAIIVAYNVALGVGSCRYPMKMYCKDAKLYCFQNKIILEAGNHIGMLPYALEVSRNLSSLLGSHEVIQEDNTELVNWGFGEVTVSVSDDIKELLKMGLTERAICSQIIPPFLEKNDFKNLQKVLTQFEDIPESIIVMLLEYIVGHIQQENVDLKDREQYHKLLTKSLRLKTLFLNKLFEIPFSDAILIPHLRNSLKLNSAVFLCNYICYLLSDTDDDITIEFESNLLDWSALLIDAFYQQFLMTKDENVSHALESLNSVVVDLIGQLNSVNEVLPLLNKLVTKKGLSDNEEILPYTIELMSI